MRTGEFFKSKYLTREDVGRGKLMTIREVVSDNVAMDDQDEKIRPIIHFFESEKGMVLNVTNNAVITSIMGTDETNDWIRRQIVVFDDPTVMMKGKIVGGIRVRAPKTQQPPVPVIPPPAGPQQDDDLPF